MGFPVVIRAECDDIPVGVAASLVKGNYVVGFKVNAFGRTKPRFVTVLTSAVGSGKNPVSDCCAAFKHRAVNFTFARGLFGHLFD